MNTGGAMLAKAVFMDCRDKPGNDKVEECSSRPISLP
jgi:hypothetical protein